MENDKKRNTIIAIALAGALVVILIIAWVVSQVSSKGETGGLKTDDGATVTTDVSEHGRLLRLKGQSQGCPQEFRTVWL